MTELRSGLPVVSFADEIALESWLAAQPSDSDGAWIRFRKKGSRVAGVTKAQAIFDMKLEFAATGPPSPFRLWRGIFRSRSERKMAERER